MTDIVERLHNGEPCGEDRCMVMIGGSCICAEAADEIERLRIAYEEAYQSAQAQAGFVRSSEVRAEELEAEIERMRKIILNLAHGFSHGEFEI